MTTTVRLPLRVEQALATYCVENRCTKSEVIVGLLEARLMGLPADTAPFDLAETAGFIGCVDGGGGGVNTVAANAKKLIRQKIRAKHSR